MLWIIYNIIFPIGFLAMLPRFLMRMKRRGGYARGFGERFASYKPDVLRRFDGGGRIWIHAVSVGEIFVALGFIDEYRSKHPDARFVLSTTTSTGRRLAEERIHAEDILIYFPLDFPWVMKRALRIIRPRLLVLVECELWPNLIRLAKRGGIPVVLINGRISEHSYRGYRKLRVFTRPLLAQADLLCVQSEREKEMLVDLGADVSRLRVLKSAKYDMTPPDGEGADEMRSALRAAGIGDGDLILLGGSTWPGEEVVLVEAFMENRVRLPDLRLVLVPRHAERADAVQADVEARGVKVVRRSRLGATEAAPGDVLLVDTTGELRRLYSLATVIFVGKSLTDHGGQNIIEPALCGKPIVVGPHMENFPVIIRDFRAADALIQVGDAAELKLAVAKLLDDAALRAALGGRALSLVRANAGALRRTVDLIDRIEAAG